MDERLAGRRRAIKNRRMMGVGMLQNLVDWIGNTSASMVIASVPWIIPAVQCVHLLAISVVMASMLMLDVRLMGVAGKRYSIEGMANRFLPWMWWSLLVLLTTGLILITGEPDRSIQNVSFAKKMIMLASVVVLSLVLRTTLKRNGRFWDTSPSHLWGARLIGGVSALLWIGIVVEGRMIAYTNN